jgi:hypothetical protein
MRFTIVPHRRDAVHRTTLHSLRFAGVVSGVVAVGALYELFFGNVDICGGSSGWWLGALFISPPVFVALCIACSTTADNEAEKATWATVGGLVALAYIYGATGTLMSGGVSTLWC